MKGMFQRGGKRAKTAGGTSDPALRRERLFRPELIEFELKATGKPEIIEELLQVLHRQGCVQDLAVAREALLAREAEVSTGLVHGLAVPHAKTDAVTELVCAVGLKHAGVAYGSVDGEPSRVFVMTLSPTSGSAPHLPFMNLIVRLLDAEGVRQCVAAATKSDLHALLLSRAGG